MSKDLLTSIELCQELKEDYSIINLFFYCCGHYHFHSILISAGTLSMNTWQCPICKKFKSVVELNIE